MADRAPGGPIGARLAQITRPTVDRVGDPLRFPPMRLVVGRRRRRAAGLASAAFTAAIAAAIAGTGLAGCATTPAGPPPVRPSMTSTPPSPAPDGWRYLFDEEFDGTALDPTKWQHCYPWGTCTNAANGEAQWYQSSNVEVRDGLLRIVARREPAVATVEGGPRNYDWTSGLINTHSSFTMRSGRLEIRAKLPGGRAVWPAFWLLPADLRYPPEIDVFELDGSVLGTVTATLHDTSGATQHRDARSTDWTADWHTWRLDRTADALTVAIDGAVVGTIDHDVPTESMYLLLNLAIGGNYVGTPDASTPDGSTLLVDWIRAYENDSEG
jgi:beta-glucanase (GH16 family)